MDHSRTAGILLHPTSLPGRGGIGTLGADAHRFLGWLHEAGLRIWQMLPLGPTGFGDSPYQSFSAFAGNPLLIHIPDIDGRFPDDHVDFGTVVPARQAALAEWLDAQPYDATVAAFVERHREWLPDYALFMALKDAHHGAPWYEWDAGTAHRDPEALARWRTVLQPDITRIYKQQCVFFRQFDELRRAAHTLGIRLMGDLPIYVAHDSADVWANRELFQLHPDGTPRVQAGVPPDYFSETGQLWGNPLYDWTRMAADGFQWWTSRVHAALHWFDLIRLDHFRGFAAYWEVPGDAHTAVSGRWVDGPGAALFHAMTRALGPLPIIAENLGVITPDVETLREAFQYPGMAILQFAFTDPASSFLPHRHARHLVVYTGTHDNDTTWGWWHEGSAEDSPRSREVVARERVFAQQYLNTTGEAMHWVLIRAALSSVADTALIPMQDVLGLGSEARMNLPGRPEGNWRFRFTWDQVTPAVTRWLHEWISLYGRAAGSGSSGAS